MKNSISGVALSARSKYYSAYRYYRNLSYNAQLDNELSNLDKDKEEISSIFGIEMCFAVVKAYGYAHVTTPSDPIIGSAFRQLNRKRRLMAESTRDSQRQSRNFISKT